MLKDLFPFGWEAAAWSAGMIAGAIVLGLVLHLVLFKLLGHFSGRTDNGVDDALYRHTRRPAQIIAPLLLILFVSPMLQVTDRTAGIIRHAVSLALIAAVAWLIVKLTSVLEELIVAHYDLAAEDNLEARKVFTQIRVLKRIVGVVVVILALGTMLTTFERVRQLGSSILASAGIIGIIVGVAAQRTLANFIAGIQIALTQPIRIDDVIIAEGEWGRVEEITFTYVVMQIWDQRRLILPISYFIEKPFQNWTRVSSDLLGTVYVYADYTVPVEAVREELHQILESAELWDRRVWNLQVTGVTDRTVELRALVSASNASDAWALRCQVREQLVRRLQERFPEHLPRLRAELERDVRGSTSTATPGAPPAEP